MNNFEEALERIEILEKENSNLKVKLKAALWKLTSSSVEEAKPFTDIQVGVDRRMMEIHNEREAAMQRFTNKLRKQAIKWKKERNGKSK